MRRVIFNVTILKIRERIIEIKESCLGWRWIVFSFGYGAGLSSAWTDVELASFVNEGAGLISSLC